MKNKTIAILLNDTFLLKVLGELAKTHNETFNIFFANNASDLLDYEVIITDSITFNQIYKELRKSQKILCIGEINKFQEIDEVSNEVSFIKIPFKYSELKERAFNLFSLIDSEKNKIKNFKHFCYDNKNRIISRNKNNLRITEKENEIFDYLLSQIGNYVSRESLLSEIWNYDKNIDTHTLETHMYSLRKKIDNKLNLKDLIKYIEKKGYLINKEFV